MNKLILALGLSLAFAAPALAQTVSEEPQVQSGAGQNPGGETGLDYGTTQSITPSIEAYPSSNDTAGSRLPNTDKQRGNQGEFFGANGR